VNHNQIKEPSGLWVWTLELDKQRDEIPFEKYNSATIVRILKIETLEFLCDAVKNAHVWDEKDGS
jgi:hypothetical protein